MKRPQVLAVALTIVLAACGGGEPEPTPSAEAPTVAQRPASPAQIAIVEPATGAAIPGPEVSVSVELTGAELIEEVTMDIRPDEGHIHLRLDGETITLLAGLEETVPDVAPGPHLLEVEFVAGDHGPFNPRILQTVTFTVV